MFAVASFVCLFLLALCQCKNSMIRNDGYSNDSPYTTDEDLTHTIRVKTGTPLTLKCNHFHKNVVWEYKKCDPAYQSTLCNRKKEDPNSWDRIKLLPRGKLDIAYSNRTHNGIYRCKQKDIVRQTYIVEVVGEDYEGYPPSVEALKISNSSNHIMEFTIQCTVNSIVQPTIIWFKQCYGLKCEIDYDKSCYCHLDLPISVHKIDNSYVSKINIFNARHQDSGVYACLAVTQYGKDYRNVTIFVPNSSFRENYKLILFLVVIPFVLIVVPGTICLCYYCKRRKKSRAVLNPAEQVSRLMANPERK